MNSMPDSLVTIATFPTAQQAHLVRGMLGAHDIPAAILDEHMSNMVGHTGYSDGLRLQVRARDVRDALELLDIADDLPDEEPPDGVPESRDSFTQADICPLCGSPKPGWTDLLWIRIGAALSATGCQCCSACGTIRDY